MLLGLNLGANFRLPMQCATNIGYPVQTPKLIAVERIQFMERSHMGSQLVKELMLSFLVHLFNKKTPEERHL